MSKLAIKGGSPVRSKSFPTWPVWGDEEIRNLTDFVNSPGFIEFVDSLLGLS